MRLRMSDVVRALALASFVFTAGLAAQARAGVTASSIHSEQYQPHRAFDGQGDTRWASRVGFSPKGEWLAIDLGKAMAFDTISVVWETAYARAYRIEVSDDGKQWKTVATKANGRGGTETFSGLGARGRHVRVFCTKGDPKFSIVSIWEVRFPTGELAKAAVAAGKRKRKRKVAPAPAVDVKELAGQLGELGVEEIVFAARECGADGHWYANFGYYSFDRKRKCYRAQGRLCKLNVKTGKVTMLVDDPTGSVRDPVVHYDAKKILFSWRKGGTEQFHLYEINVDGTGLKQLTKGIYDDIEPTYLPDGDIIFVSSRAKRWVQCWLTSVAVLYRCGGDGKNVRQISANVEHDNTPWVLPDGRIMYQRWEYVDRSQVDYHHLWTANPDGTGQMVYYGNLHPSRVFIDAKPIPGTNEVLLINSPGHGANEHRGYVAIVSDKNGPDDRSSMRNISGNGYHDPYPLSAETFLVARNRQMMLMNRQGHTSVLYSLGKEFGRSALLHEPRPIMERKRERIHPPRVRPSLGTGLLMLMDVYNGRNMKGVKKGDIKKLLIVESLPKPINFTGGMDPLTYGGSFTLERVIGAVPVEADGSAYMEVPAKRAIFFIALDANDNTVKRMQSFVSVMPGEITSCVGCHEERKSIVANNPTTGRPSAMKRPPSTPTPIKGVPDVFDFPRDIQPILDKHCITCHNPRKHNAGVVLTGGHGPMFSHSYFTLTWRKQFVDGRNRAVSNLAPRTIGTSASPIMKKITGGHQKDVKLSPGEVDMIRYWIEVGSPYPGTYASLGCGSIGGYQHNRQFNTDKGWPELKAYQAAIRKRCASCHKGKTNRLPTSMSDELGMSFWRFDGNDPRLQYSRHRLFDLSKPAESLVLVAPLARKAGGAGMPKRGKDGKPTKEFAEVFKSTDDPDYKAILAFCQAGRRNLETIKRFDMPGFRPRPGYIREMKKYGMLPQSFNVGTDPLNCYELDRKYWRSLWYYPPGTKGPELYNNDAHFTKP